MKQHLTVIAALILSSATATPNANAQDVEVGDLVIGLGTGDGLTAVEWVRGDPVENGGMNIADNWDESFVQAMEFDNLNGISHNPQGNLLAATFGSSDGGGTVHSLAACTSTPTDQQIGDSIGMGGEGLNLTRWGGLSVSPDNTKIALTGYDTGAIIVFDYSAGDCNGGGASLSDARQTADATLTQFVTQGTAWLDNETVIAFDADGDVVTIDATSMETTTVKTVEALQDGSRYTDVEYNSTVSPFLFLSHSTFDGATTNKMFVLDPTADFDDVAEAIDFSESAQTAREIALSADGHLFIGQFGGDVDILLDVTDPANVVANASIDWYTPITSANFSGLDVAVGKPIGGGDVDADFNDDGSVDGLDLDMLFDDIDANNNSAALDLNGDGSVNSDDVTSWLADAGDARGFSGPIRPGDTDFNGIVDAADLNTVGINWQANATSWTEGDFDNSGQVNAGDLNGLGVNWLSDITGPAAATVPEPTSLPMILIGLLWAAGRRRNA